MNTFTFTVYLTPYWPNQPNTILIISYFTTSGYSYSASIAGPGLAKPVVFPDNNSGCLTNVIPESVYKTGASMPYEITITTNSPTLSGRTINSTEMGAKTNGEAISYQGFLFTNDAGSDNDWNDCVINLGLYNDSTD
ncbi:hypothetical protein [Fluviicola taffensis]|uniref:hypothetical protein n=1 Tax=Fluviicola taffensis TaxID=191579 RepID=UPI003137B6D2